MLGLGLREARVFDAPRHFSLVWGSQSCAGTLVVRQGTAEPGFLKSLLK